jgi:hypothetical protein
MMNPSSKTVFYAFLSIGLAILAIDFLFIYLPLSGWVLQAILVGVYLEYLKPKRTLLLVAIMEIFFITSYGGTVAVSAVLSLFSGVFVLPLIVGLYFGLILAVFALGCLTNYFFHKVGLFRRLGHKKD